MTNFRRPYFSRSVAEFWRRWHISLSTWLKDYVYIPLGGNRRGAARQKFNLLVTFLLSGLWHGAAWHFVIWGALHGVFQIIGRSTAPFRDALGRRIGLDGESTIRKAIQVCVTFLLVSFAWIFFRADTIGDALLVIAKLAALPAELAGYVRFLPQTGLVGTVREAFQLGIDVASPVEGFGITQCGLSLICIAVLIISDIWTRKDAGTEKIARKPPVLRWAGYYALVLAILLSWNAGPSQFIYFTF
jgi:hypothetical protein